MREKAATRSRFLYILWMKLSKLEVESPGRVQIPNLNPANFYTKGKGPVLPYEEKRFANKFANLNVLHMEGSRQAARTKRVQIQITF